MLYDTSVQTTSAASGSNYLSLIPSGREQHQQSFNDTYTALIIEEAEKLYNDLTIELTNEVMAAAAAIRASPLPLSLPSNYMQNLTHKNDEIEKPRYNN